MSICLVHCKMFDLRIGRATIFDARKNDIVCAAR